MKDSVKIGGHIVDIKYRDIEDCGKCYPDKNLIVIDVKLPQSQQEEALWHEILHYIRMSLELDLEDEKAEEKIVQPMGHALYQILKDNKIIK